MAEDFLGYETPGTSNERVRTHTNNAAGAAERVDEYVRHADEFVTVGFPIYTATCWCLGYSYIFTVAISPRCAICEQPQCGNFEWLQGFAQRHSSRRSR